jgi:DNA-binding NarL/FixJ family response regulator
MIRVVLVEDHASFRQAMAAVLSLEPDMEVAAQLGTGVIETARAAAAAADVAVVDLELPEGDGLGVIAALRDGDPPTPSVVLTGLRDDRQLGLAIEAGAAAVLSKTAEMAQIIDAIRVVAAGGSVLPPVETSRRLQALAKDRDRHWRSKLLADQLTARESEIIEHLVYGLGNTEIAVRLGISPETVQTHIRNLMGKLGASSRLEAVSLALQHGLVDPP